MQKCTTCYQAVRSIVVNAQNSSQSVVVLAGGVGAARFLRGLAQVIEPRLTTAVVNTGDDTVLHGLNISPDIDTVIYTLAQAIDAQRGWGLTDESWRAMDSLKRYAKVRPSNSTAAPEWFNLGDQDLATHFYRTARRSEGADAWQITREIAAAWSVEQQIVPMTNQDVSTVVELAEDCIAGKSGQKISFQECISKNLKVMDTTAFTLCMENKLPIIVFDMNQPGNLLKVVQGAAIGTLVG